ESESGGLNPPQCILDATNAYLEEEDELGTWLDDCFKFEVGAFTTTEMIMQSYTRWSELNGLNKRLHARQLTEPLQARSNRAQKLISWVLLKKHGTQAKQNLRS
ncbi:MAG: hypothetical protein EBV46_02795, partial [Burkholderiaceae bacterium]|nr:hypothetical protein [Burkholderiaceae bacterium]